MSAYLVIDITVHDQELYHEYVERVPRLVAKHGGDYLIRGGNPEPLEGSWCPERLVVLRFPDAQSARVPDAQSARAFVEDPDYAPVKAIRHQAADTNLVLAQGC